LVGLKGGQLEILSFDELYAIHQSAMQVLEDVGVAVLEPTAFQLLKANGAGVDERSRRVWIPEYLVKDAVGRAPSRFTLHGRNSLYDVRIEAKRVYFGPMIGRLNILDIETGHRRRTNLSDVENLVKLTDALDSYRLIHSGAIMPEIEDVPSTTAHVQGYLSSLKNTSKVVKATARGRQRARDCLRMAAVLAGGVEELRKRPMVYTTVNPISPLTHSLEMTEGLIEYARLGQPVDVCPEIQAGATGPVTLAGVLVQQTAEALSGIAIAELVNPGAPVFYGCCSTVMDMRRGAIALGAIEAGLLNVASAQISRYYGLPSRGSAGDTESKVIDVQNGYERSSNMLLSALAGINYIFYPGTLESAKTVSLEQLVIDDEICQMAYRAVKGITVDQDTLGVNTIAAVGPGGHFFGQEHTLKFLQEQLIPSLSNRQSREEWEKAGSKDLWAVARQRAKDILKQHHPEPLDPSLEKELSSIVKEIEKRGSDPSSLCPQR